MKPLATEPKRESAAYGSRLALCLAGTTLRAKISGRTYAPSFFPAFSIFAIRRAMTLQ
jgi:hypothetical protein